MKTVGELLRSADPLGYESSWSSQQRLAIEERVLASPHAGSRTWLRRTWLTATATLVLIAGIAVAPRFSSSALQAAVRFEVRLAEESPAPDLQPAIILPSGRAIYLHEEAVVTNADIAEANVVRGDSPSTFGVEVTFDAEGAEKMWIATGNHLGKPVAILVDGEIIAAPVVRSPIGDKAYLTGDYSRAEAERLAGGMIGQ
ncbi:MAG: hypothetical protein EHM55_13230 [Acidobacteria bacterium]|nr:MAG: hypothetical protein EHM55_13230 [Acidobacteriota bacterium]